ncbi:MAG: hypothetical protein FWC41_06870, partial [Firmicutes bacterium]|nr:hypothetical protein [Bacillota bacterium]
MIENKFLSITMFAIIIEALITYLNEFLVSGNIQWKMILSIILGTIMTIAYNLDILEYLNFKSNIPYIGPIITGI